MSIWEAAARLIEDAIVNTYTWACQLDECDGQPHPGHDYKHARTKQRLPEGDWFIWLLLCGRGFGKTRTGSECFLDMVIADPVDTNGIATEWLVAGATHDDTVKLLMEGVSSLSHALARRGITYRYNKNEKLVTLSTGQRIMLDNAEDEDLGRGGNWAGVWLDEVGMFKRIKYAWEEALIPSMRADLPSGRRPRLLLTTTPKVRRKDAFQLLRKLRGTTDGSVVVTVGSTWENKANIPETQIELWKSLYPEGTRAYRQEFMAELTDEVEGALWFQATIDDTRIKHEDVPKSLTRVVVAVDPAASNNPDSDDTGIVTAGSLGGIQDRTYYVLADDTSHGTPDEWGKAAVLAWKKHDADAIVYESNQGGEMVRSVLVTAARDLMNTGGIDRMPKVTAVRATRGKAVRAEPIAALYQQGRVHHAGPFPKLEDQLTTWTPDEPKSPDRLDALVWALTHLSTGGSSVEAFTMSRL
jgi:phage terminase large subunit-like protein